MKMIFFLNLYDPLEEGMTTHSSILVWRISWTEEPGRLQSMGLQRVGHDWATNIFIFHTFNYWLKFSLGTCITFICKIEKKRWCLLWASVNYISKSKGNIQFSSVTQSCPTLCDPMNCSTPGLPVHHQLPASTQTHVHCVGDAIQPSHPLSSPSPPALNLSQHQGLFKWVSSSHQVTKVLEFQLQHQSSQWTFRTDFL